MRVFQHLFVTALLGVWLAARLVRRRGLPSTPLNPLLYVMVIVWIVSALVSLDPRMALENLWFPLTNLLLFFLMVDVLQSGQENLPIETQFLLAALVVVLAGAQFGSYLFGWGFGTPRVGWLSVLGGDVPLPLVPPALYVPIGVSTWLAAYTAPLAVLAGVGGLAARRRGTRIVLWVMAAGLVAVMVLTGSRGGWISLGASAAVFGALRLLRSEYARRFARRYAIPLLIALALVVAGGAFVLMRISSQGGHLTGDILRFDLWRGALNVTADYPLLGVGPGMFGEAYRLFRDPAYVDNRLDTAHNLYLNSLAETGVLGAVVGLALIGALLWRWRTLWMGAETSSRQLRLEGALAALIGFGAQSFFDTFTSLPLVLLALGLVAYCVTEPRSRLSTPTKGSIPAAVVSLVLLLVYGAGLIRSDQAQAAFREGLGGARDAIAQAVALDPGLRLYTLQAAYLSGLNDPPEQAIPAYEHALELAPTWDMGWINLAGLRQWRGDIPGALDALQYAINIDNANGALLLWARLAEAMDAAPPEAIVDAYLRHIQVMAGYNKLPLSSFWSQTELRRQAVDAFEHEGSVDWRYRIAAAHDPERLAAIVPTDPVSAEDWWVVGEYALTVQDDAAAAENAFSQAIARRTHDTYLGDYYASRARARIATDPQGALRDLNIAQLIGTVDESPNAVRALLVTTPESRRAYLANAVPQQIIDQNFEGTLFGGRGADFRPLPEMRLPGPGHAAMQPWYDLAADYLSAGETEQAANVYRAIVERAPEEDEARAALARLGADDSP